MTRFIKVGVYMAQQLAYFLQRLRSLKEGRGTVLDNSMIVYGSGLGDSEYHDNNDLPILLCGGGGGTIRSGRYIAAAPQPLANLHLALIARMGVKAERWRDSTKMLDLTT